MPPSPRHLLPPALRTRLETLVAQRTAAEHHKERAQIWLTYDDGFTKAATARQVEVVRDTARKWIQRMHEHLPALRALEDDHTVSGAARQRALERALDDAPRPGTPPTFTPEQVVAILALAQTHPSQSGYEVSHWTPKLLADEAIKRDIVDTIHASTVGRFLKSGGHVSASDQDVGDST